MLQARGQQFAARHIGRIDDRDIAGGKILLVVDRIGKKSSTIGEAAYLQHAGDGNLGRLLRELELVLPFAGLVAHGAELVNPAQRRLVERGGEFRADAPDVDLRVLVLQAGDDVLVEIVAGENLRVGKSTSVENL